MAKKTGAAVQVNTAAGGRSFWKQLRKQKTLVLMALLPVIMVIIFKYIPMYGILIAFKNYKSAKGVWGSKWLDPLFKNFITFFKNVNCWQIIWNTFRVGALTLLFTFPAPIIFAVLLNELRGKTYKKVVQTVSYIPHFISVVVICSMLNGFGSTSGLFNDIRELLGMARVDMNNGSKYFLLMYVGSAVWQGIGWGSIMYLSALSNVDTSLYDVANIDGANRWQKIKNIIWPTIMPTTTVLLIMNVGNVLNSDYTKVLLMQNDTNRSELEVIGTFVYQKGIVEGKFSYSTAVNLFVSIICFILVFGANMITRKVNPETVFGREESEMSLRKTKKQAQPESKIYIGSKVFDVFLILFMLILSVIFLYPFLNVVATSLSSNRMITTGQVTFFPRELMVDGYKMLFKEQNILGAYWNTIVIAVGTMVISLSLTSLMAYVMMVPDFVLRKQLSVFLLITMFFSGGTVPTYLLIQNLGLYNSWWSLILPNAVTAYNVFVYRSFYKGISPEIREAARIDGAGDLKILTKIYVPLSKALYATFGLFSVVGVWNSYYEALLYIKDPGKQPIQMLLRKIVFTSGTANMADSQQMISNGAMNQLNVQYACVIATIGPILLVYPFIQKYFAQGMQVGAVKG